MARDTSVNAYLDRKESGQDKTQAVQALQQYYFNWARGGIGMTDDELGVALEIETGMRWKDSSVSGARLHWMECSGKRKDCEKSHEDGETHTGHSPLLQATNLTRETSTGHEANVWQPTALGLAKFRKRQARVA